MRASSLCIATFETFLTAILWAQPSATPAVASRVATLPNGIEISQGELHEQILALRDDVLRVRAWRGDKAPEDASWAVLASARHSSAAVTPANSSNRAGFHTVKLFVDVDERTLK